MKRLSLWIAALLAACLAEAQASGLGAVHVHSALGQPLQVGIPVLGLPNGALNPHCVKARVESLDGFAIAVPRVKILDGREHPSLLIQTSKSINEPIVTVSVVIDCEVPVRRDYQVFLDPPSMRPEEPLLPHATTEDHADKPARKAASAGQADADSTASPVPRSPAPVPAQKRSRRADGKRSVNSVLRLSAPDMPEEMSGPLRLRLSGTLTLPDKQPPEKLAELRRMQRRVAAVLNDVDYLHVTESRLEAIESEAAALRVEMARLRQANESANDDAAASRKTTTHWILGLGAALTACLTALAWTRRRMGVAHGAPQGNKWAAHLERLRRKWKTEPGPLLGLDEAEDDSPAADAAPAPAAAAKVPDARSAAAQPAHPLDDQLSNAFENQVVKAEEISDMLELAEAWLVLNQPRSVIDTLKPMDTDDPPLSPLPWIYLMHAYRLVGEQENYESLAQRIRKTFNLNVPEWDLRLASQSWIIKSLSDFPHIKERIIRLWGTDEIIPYLKSLLVDDRQGERMGLPLQVYQDILRLLRIAQDPQRERIPGNMLSADFLEKLLQESVALDVTQFAYHMAREQDEAKTTPVPG